MAKINRKVARKAYLKHRVAEDTRAIAKAELGQDLLDNHVSFADMVNQVSALQESPTLDALNSQELHFISLVLDNLYMESRFELDILRHRVALLDRAYQNCQQELRMRSYKQEAVNKVVRAVNVRPYKGGEGELK